MLFSGRQGSATHGLRFMTLTIINATRSPAATQHVNVTVNVQTLSFIVTRLSGVALELYYLYH
jgi:hypothetical protein